MKSQPILVAGSDQIHNNQGLAEFIPCMTKDTDTFFNSQTVSGEDSILEYDKFRRS
jgi:hypothetical protein